MPRLSLSLLPVACIAALLLAAPSVAAQGLSKELAAQYKVEGVAANGTALYEGTAEVERVGDTYTVVWQLQDGREVYLGTGIRRGDSFAVVYQSPHSPMAPGLVLYSIAEGGAMTGYYSSLGASTIGAETWIPVSH